MQSLAKKPNVLFLIAVRPRKAIRFVRSDYELPAPYLGKLILNLSLNIRGFGMRFHKKYIRANLIKQSLFYSNRQQRYIIDKRPMKSPEYTKNLADVWSINGVIHHDSKPAIIKYHKINSTTSEICEVTYYQLSFIHRENGPAYINYLEHSESWIKNGLLHREDGPAYITHNQQKWYWNGQVHRDNGPAWIHSNGDIQHWYQHGKLHRDNGPAIIYKYSTHNVDHHYWYRNGKSHRDDGPAFISFDTKNNTILASKWFRNGEEIDPNYHLKLLGSIFCGLVLAVCFTWYSNKIP